MFEWPRNASMPPPGRPTLPSRSWRTAPARIIWTPVECCVQPSAYVIVPTRWALPVEVTVKNGQGQVEIHLKILIDLKGLA